MKRLILILAILVFGISLFGQIHTMPKLDYVFPGYIKIKKYLVVNDSIVLKEIGSLPVNPQAGTLVLYQDTLRQYTGTVWLKLGGGSGAVTDPHITDSTIIITYPTLGSNAFNIHLSPYEHGYMGVGYIQHGTDGGFTFFVDSANFSWQGYSTLNGGGSLGTIGFYGDYGLFNMTYKGGDTIIIADTIGIRISNEDSSLWNDNNVITKKYFEDRMTGGVPVPGLSEQLLRSDGSGGMVASNRYRIENDMIGVINPGFDSTYYASNGVHSNNGSSSMTFYSGFSPALGGEFVASSIDNRYSLYKGSNISFINSEGSYQQITLRIDNGSGVISTNVNIFQNGMTLGGSTIDTSLWTGDYFITKEYADDHYGSGGGGGTSYTFSKGLTELSGAVTLGGNFISDIDISSNNGSGMYSGNYSPSGDTWWGYSYDTNHFNISINRHLLTNTATLAMNGYNEEDGIPEWELTATGLNSLINHARILFDSSGLFYDNTYAPDTSLWTDDHLITKKWFLDRNIGGGGGADPHITDSTILLSYNGAYLDIQISRYADGKFDYSWSTLSSIPYREKENLQMTKDEFYWISEKWNHGNSNRAYTYFDLYNSFDSSQAYLNIAYGDTNSSSYDFWVSPRQSYIDLKNGGKEAMLNLSNDPAGDGEFWSMYLPDAQVFYQDTSTAQFNRGVQIGYSYRTDPGTIRYITSSGKYQGYGSNWKDFEMNNGQPTGSLTDGIPTTAEINFIIGTAVGKTGYKVTIKDSDGTGLLYQVESDGTDWFYKAMTKAL